MSKDINKIRALLRRINPFPRSDPSRTGPKRRTAEVLARLRQEMVERLRSKEYDVNIEKMRVIVRREAIYDLKVLEAMGTIPREEFVRKEDSPRAYEDISLDIGYGQLLSPPRTIGKMLELLKLTGEETILDVGSGSGYQAALSSRLAREVTAIEIIPQLAERSRVALARLGIINVKVITGNARVVLSGDQTFDRIVVAAQSKDIPEALIAQLNEGGILVIPIIKDITRIVVIAKKGGKIIFIEEMSTSGFVPLVGQ